MEQIYTNKSIEVLDDLEHIRKRPGMTKSRFQTEVRQQFEGLTPHAQDLAAKQAFGRGVFYWSSLSMQELDRLCGAITTMRLLIDEIA